MEVYNIAKGNETCCHICKLCKNHCSMCNTCSGACAGCPHPCWVDWKQYGKTWILRDAQKQDSGD